MTLPSLSIDFIEALWIVVNTSTLVLTISAWLDARTNEIAVKKLNGRATEFAARGQVRRETFRIICQILLISIVIPGLFIDRPVNLSPPVIALIIVPIILLISSLYDARDRKVLTLLAVVRLVSESERTIARIEAKIDEILARKVVTDVDSAK